MTAVEQQLPFLNGGGEMGERIRSKDWSTSPLGTPGTWPQSLRTAVSVILNSRFPMFVWWGAELITIYNDAYCPIAGEKHPALLGTSGKEGWIEIWPDLSPLVKSVFSGTSTWSEDQVLYMNRHGYVEETYFTFSYSPIWDDIGKVAGLYCACIETTEKVFAARKIQESESNLRNMIIHAPVAMCLLKGPSFVVELANDRVFEIWGKGPDEMLHKPVFESLPEAGRLGLEREMQRVYTTGEPFIANELAVPLPRNGVIETIYLNFIYEAYKDIDANITGITAVAIEVTEQVIARKKIEHAEQRARLAIESADLGTYEVDLKTNHIITSARFQAIWELEDTVARSDYARLIHPSDLLIREKAISESYSTGNLKYEVRLITSRNKIKWVRVTGTVLYDQQRQAVRLLGVVQDITEQKQFAEELENQVEEQTKELMQAHLDLVETNDYLQRIINVFNVPLQVLKPVLVQGEVVDFTYRLTNAAYAAYAKTTPKELEDKRVGDVFPGYFKTDSFKKVVETYKTGISNTWENYYKEDGLDIYNEMSAVVLGDEVVVHFTDFTTLKKLQLDLIRKVEELERSNQNLEEFTHAASHDLKEPIRKVHVFSNMLKKSLPTLTGEQHRFFERMEDATQRMGLLIDDLLDYSHVSMGVDLTEQIDLNKKVRNVLNDLEVAIQEKGAQITVGSLPIVKGHRRQLQQLFYNLIQNALKYSKKDVAPIVNITSKLVLGSATSFELLEEDKNKSFHLILVQDNGIGFEQEHALQIFQMFKRLHGRQEYSGSGVGLAIVKKVVENHNGYIRAEGTPGAGATFEILLREE